MLNHASYGFSSKNLCTRPRTGPCTRAGTPLAPVGLDNGRPTAERIAQIELGKLTDKTEQQVRDALFARSTAHIGEERILRAAFNKFDKDRSKSIDFHEFQLALEHLGLHTEGDGLDGCGGLPLDAVKGLFARYDVDGGGTVDYEEFISAIMKEAKYGTKML